VCRRSRGSRKIRHLRNLLDKAGVKTAEKPAVGKALSAYEKMKAEKAPKAAQTGDKK